MQEHAKRGADYATDVAEGRILACEYVQLACKRHLSDLEREDDDNFDYYFDAEAAHKACRFIEHLPHTKGRWAIAKPGKPESNNIRLEPWQSFIVGSVFGWKRKSDDLRRFRIAYIEVPRKNGKSHLAAGIGLWMFAADGEYGAEVYSGATTEKQAWEVFRPARTMAKRTPPFVERYGVDVNAKSLAIVGDGSRFEPIIGKPGDGASPSCAIVDEYHEHPSDELYDTMLTGMGAREQPMMFVITTSGSDTAGPCYALRTDVVRMLEGALPNDELFGIVYTIDEDEDWTDEAALQKANPNYDVSVSGEYLRRRQLEAVNASRKQSTFKTKHLNVWVTARDPYFNVEWWAKGDDGGEALTELSGEPCWMALDLSSKTDLTATVKVWPLGGEDFYVSGRYYVPEAAAEEPDKAHYMGWFHDGHLELTDGEIIDYARIRSDLLEDDSTYGVHRLAFDPWGATQLAQELEVEGVTVVEVPQRVSHLSEPMKWLNALMKAGRIKHDGNPVLTWMLSNVTAKVDPNDNVFPRKERPENKIDGAVALIMALGQAMAGDENEPEPMVSVW